MVAIFETAQNVLNARREQDFIARTLHDKTVLLVTAIRMVFPNGIEVDPEFVTGEYDHMHPEVRQMIRDSFDANRHEFILTASGKDNFYMLLLRMREKEDPLHERPDNEDLGILRVELGTEGDTDIDFGVRGEEGIISGKSLTRVKNISKLLFEKAGDDPSRRKAHLGYGGSFIKFAELTFSEAAQKAMGM